jgi:hypothetical protein
MSSFAYSLSEHLCAMFPIRLTIRCSCIRLSVEEESIRDPLHLKSISIFDAKKVISYDCA